MEYNADRIYSNAVKKELSQIIKSLNKNNEIPTMDISNCLLLPACKNPSGFSVWFVLAKLSVKPRNYS